MHDPIHAPLGQLLLVSQAPADPAQTEAVIAHTHGRHTARGLTGVLLFSGGHFVQVIEGSAEGVAARLAELERDARHARLTLLLRRDVPRRRFVQWHLGRLDLAGGDALLRSLITSAPLAPDRADRLLTRVEAIVNGASTLSDPA